MRCENSWARAVAVAGVFLFAAGDVAVGQIDINVLVPGRVLLRFDGEAITSVGDRIMLAASDNGLWEVNQGHVSVESPNADQNATSFAHSRVFDIAPGSHSFYAVAENWVEQDGTGVASIYGTLTLEFVPTGHPTLSLAQRSIAVVREDIRSSGAVALQEIQVTADAFSRVLARVDGSAIGSPGDRVLLAANNIPDWQVNSGHVSFEPVDDDVNRSPFSHTRAYDQQAGSASYFAAAENWVEQSGTGEASVYGHLTVQVFEMEDLFRDSFESP